MPLVTENIFNAIPPETLYHYTNQTGLLGIIASKSIWATHSEYLNDQSEFVHALKIVRAALKDRVAGSSGADNTMWREMQDAVASDQIMNVCVCSFSEDRDSLSQWRAYGGLTSSFALGIPGDLIQRATTPPGYYLARCIYDPDEQRALASQLVDDIFAENMERQIRAIKGTAIPDDEDAPPGGYLVARLNRYAPVMKFRKFSEEREWRVISKPTMNRRISFREGKSTIIPYVALPLELEGTPFALNEVVVGPTPDQERAMRAVSGLLIGKGLMGHRFTTTVNPSDVPYRNW